MQHRIRWIAVGHVAVLAVLLGPRFYVADLEDALVREANEIVAAPRVRPTHVDRPSSGTFADALRGPLHDYESAWKALEESGEAKQLLAAVARRERPISDLPPETRSRLLALDAPLDAMLRASRAQRADLGPDHQPFGPIKGASWLPVQQAAKHAAIRIGVAPGRDGAGPAPHVRA
jgi:hypothetical protein